MTQLTFLRFFQGEYEEEGFELYILRDCTGQAMYVGISRDSVWNRWFGGTTSHMEQLPHGVLAGNDDIGEVVQRRFPEAWKWSIELSTREQCIRNLIDTGVTKVANRNVRSAGIFDLEAFLINQLSPIYNGLHAGIRQEDPLRKKELDEAYKKIFNSDG